MDLAAGSILHALESGTGLANFRPAVPRYPLEVAALRAALAACEKEPYNPQRCEDVFDCVTVLTNAMHRGGMLVEYVVIGLRAILLEYPRKGVEDDAVIRHAIEQYFR
jgi:hypothetical protein